MNDSIAKSSSLAVDPVYGRVGSTLLRECEAMVLYALGAGVHLPLQLLRPFGLPLEVDRQTSAGDTANATSLEDLSQIHAILSDLIAPATPRAITLMHEEKARHPRLTAFGPVPIIRQLLLVACVSLLAMLLVALSPHINPSSMQHDLLEGEGMNLFVCELFLVSASALGSSFAALFKLNRYITLGTYDPRYSSTYWIQLALGIIAGVVLSQIIFHTLEGSNGTAAHRAFDQPILALIGGFSASLVYRILNRILTAIETLFGTDPNAGDAFADLQNRRRQNNLRRVSVGVGSLAVPASMAVATQVAAPEEPVLQPLEQPHRVPATAPPAALPARRNGLPPLRPPLRTTPFAQTLQSNGLHSAPSVRAVALQTDSSTLEEGAVIASDPD